MNDLLFLDTEWATDATRELVSLALVNEDGSRRFYAERDPLPGVASSFVRSTVYPLLERGDTALPDPVFTERLRAFVASFYNPQIYFDGRIDMVQLDHALSGFGHRMGNVPPYIPVLVMRPDVIDELELYFQEHPEAMARRHHAGVDAEALRCAFSRLGSREYTGI